jgi:NADPH-dependent ferric siderophore reductase
MFGEVVAVEQLSPGMVRVILGGGDLHDFQSTGATDEYINAQFLPEGAPYTVPFDPSDLDGVAADLRPKPRRFTVRHWDADRGSLTIDFVAHGDVGYAGRWAQRTAVGDRLQFKGPGGGYRPDHDADWYLFAGDESALPAIARSIEQLSPEARGIALVVVDGPDYEQPIASPAHLDLLWLHRQAAPAPENLLVETLASIEFPPGRPDVFVHGEAGEVRDVRRHLAEQRGIDVDSASISPYWRRNLDDESWRAVKAQWLSEQPS